MAQNSGQVNLASIASIFGDGSDFAGSLTGFVIPSWATLSGTTYTLTQNVCLTNLVIASGKTLITNGFILRCAGTIRNNGTIAWDGNPAVGSVRGAAHSTQFFPGGVAGGTGGIATGNGSVGSAISPGEGGNGGAGGQSGGGLHSGGAGGIVTPFTAAQGTGFHTLESISLAQLMIPGGIAHAIAGGGGGGGGGGDGTNAGGGGGGGGGPLIILAAQFAGTGFIHSRGGNGAQGVGGNAGSGGGGGGGGIYIISGSCIASVIAGQTVDANGGTGGIARGTGTAGSDGAPGPTRLIAA